MSSRPTLPVSTMEHSVFRIILILGAEFVCSCLLPAMVIGLWVYTLRECLTLEPSDNNPDKLHWLLVVILIPVLGSVLYLYLRRPARKLKYGK